MSGEEDEAILNYIMPRKRQDIEKKVTVGMSPPRCNTVREKAEADPLYQLYRCFPEQAAVTVH